MTQKLNDRQRRMVEGNYPYVLYFTDIIKSFFETSDTYYKLQHEDWHGILSTALCKSALIYDENKTHEKFGEFAVSYIIDATKEHIRKFNDSEDALNEALDLTYILEQEGTLFDHGNDELLQDAPCSHDSITYEDTDNFEVTADDIKILQSIVEDGMSPPDVSHYLNVPIEKVISVRNRYLLAFRDFFSE